MHGTRMHARRIKKCVLASHVLAVQHVRVVHRIADYVLVDKVLAMQMHFVRLLAGHVMHAVQIQFVHLLAGNVFAGDMRAGNRLALQRMRVVHVFAGNGFAG